MDTQTTLQQLDQDTVNEAFTIQNDLQSVSNELNQLQSLISSAQATVQAIQSGPPASTQPLQQLNNVIKIGTAFLQASSQLQSVLQFDVASLQQSIQQVQGQLANVATLQAQAVSQLQTALTIYQTLQSLSNPQNALGIAKAAFTSYVTDWFTNATTFDIEDGDSISLQFTTSLDSKFPFSATAGLSATVFYQGFSATVSGLFLTADTSGNVTPSFKNANVSSDFSIAQFANVIASNLGALLPEGVTLGTPPFDSHGVLTVKGSVEGLSGFDGLSMDATLAISAKGARIIDANAELPDVLIPIPPGVFAMRGVGLGYRSQPFLNITGPSLRIETSVVVDGDDTGSISFDIGIIRSDDGLFISLQPLAQSFAFQGNLILLQSFTCGRAIAAFTSSPSPLLTLAVTFPAENLGNTPFGAADIFSLDAHSTVDKAGIHLTSADGQPSTATYLSFITGTVKGDILFDGSGHVTVTSNANVFGIIGSNASFSADWQPGFSKLNVQASVSVGLSLPGFTDFSVSAVLSGPVPGHGAFPEVQAEILGWQIPDGTFLNSSNIEQFLASLLADESTLGNMLKKVLDQANDLIKKIGQQANQFLQRAIGNLQPFVKASFQPALDMFNNAESSIEHGAGSVGSTLSGWAKNVEHTHIPGFGLDGTVPALVSPPSQWPSTLPPLVVSNVTDALEGTIRGSKMASTVANLLGAVGQQLAQQAYANNSGKQVDTRLFYRLDQVVLSADGVDSTNNTADSITIAFLLTGGSSTRRNSQEIHASFVHWGYVKFVYTSNGTPLASIVVSANEPSPPNPRGLSSDASLFCAQQVIYAAVKTQILSVAPEMGFGDLNNPNGDPNDPGPVPAVDLNFGQPPAGMLPVLGILGINAIGIVTVGTSPGAFIKDLNPTGAAARAGLMKDDVVMSMNGTSVTSAHVFGQAEANTTDGTLTVVYNRQVVGGFFTSTVTVKLDPLPLVNVQP